MTVLVRGLCPQCGIPVWIGPDAETHADVRAQIRAEGGYGRRHVCRMAAAIEEPSVETIQATYVKPRPIELEPVRQEIDWLARKGRSFAPGAAIPRSGPDGSGQ